MEVSLGDAIKIGGMVVTAVTAIVALRYQVRDNAKKVEALETKFKEDVEEIKDTANAQFKSTVTTMITTMQENSTQQMQAVKDMVGAFTNAFSEMTNLGTEMRESVGDVHKRIDEAFEEFRKQQIDLGDKYVSQPLCKARMEAQNNKD